MDFYKHDIPDWMDGTEDLDDGPYRVYHVVCQLIYLAEGPIKLNEHGIAGRCKQSIRSFRANLKALLDDGKLALSEGRLSNSRAKKELEKVSENRLNASKGGLKSAEVRSSAHKPLEINNVAQASLKDDRSLIEKTRLEKKESLGDAGASLRKKPPYSQDFEDRFWSRYAKGSKADAWKQWRALSPEDRNDACKAIDQYKASVRDPQFWVDSCRYLSQRRFENFVNGGAVVAAPQFDIRSVLV